MTTETSTATRRSVLAALAGTPALVGTIAATIAVPADAAEPDAPDTEAELNEYFDLGQELAYLEMARAWMNRWAACGASHGTRTGHFAASIAGSPCHTRGRRTTKATRSFPRTRG